MIVLSLFDGMACGYEALKRAGIPVTKYYASEVDKYAIEIAMKNHPDIVQLGDVRGWQKWEIERPDIIMAGSPCQGFSYQGRGLAFEDPRSALYFKFEDIVNHYAPRYILLENVKMKPEWRDVISSRLGIEPIMIDSALVSAQSRKRYYWTNIKGIEQPEDRKIYLTDILEYGDVDRLKSYALDAHYYKGTYEDHYKEYGLRQIVYINKPDRLGTIGKNSRGQRTYTVNGKSVALLGNGGGQGAKTGLYYNEVEEDDYVIRKLTPVECERLQTLPDNYTEGVSDTQRYRMLGNGWTVEVIAHILGYIDV